MADTLPDDVAGLIPAVAAAALGGVIGRDMPPDERTNAVAGAALCAVHDYAPGAPVALKREAAIRLSGWLLGAAPHATRRKTADPSGTSMEVDFHGMATGNALRASGASSLLARYVVRRAGVIG